MERAHEIATSRKLGFFTDLHGDLPALHRVLHLLAETDDLYFLGDLAGGRYDRECLDLMASRRVKAVAGNHDLYEFEQTGLHEAHKSILRSWPLTMEGPGFLALHSYFQGPREKARFHYLYTPEDARLLFDSRPHRLFFVGHTHKSQVFEQTSELEVRLHQVHGALDFSLAPTSRYIINVGAAAEAALVFEPQAPRLKFLLTS